MNAKRLRIPQRVSIMLKIIIQNLNNNNPEYIKGAMDKPHQHLHTLPDTNGGQGETMAELIPDHCSTWYIPINIKRYP